MILTDEQYQNFKEQVTQWKKGLAAETERLQHSMNLTPEQAKRATDPATCLYLDTVDEVKAYEQAKDGRIRPIKDLTQLGPMLIQTRIAAGVTQKELADRLGVPETDVARAEHNEYWNITTVKAQRILAALGANLNLTIDFDSR